ncbi:conserved hypothetical protein [Arthrobacter sp. Hiyo8]|nr:conserved hypothetical protein [Arthrobacter sp. Hiyo8]
MKDQLRESSPTQDLRAYLLGSWTVERSLWDRAGGTRGTFAGVVRYSETPDGGLFLREDGTMTWPTHTGPPSANTSCGLPTPPKPWMSTSLMGNRSTA